MPSKTIPGTLRFPDWCLSSFAGSRRMLEIGCGPTGGLSELAIEIGAEFCGMEYNELVGSVLRAGAARSGVCL